MAYSSSICLTALASLLGVAARVAGLDPELLIEAGLLPLRRLDALMQEADQLLSIFVAAIKTTRSARQS